MASFHSVHVKVFDRGNYDKSYNTAMDVRNLAGSERFLNGLKALGICLGVAIVVIPVPGLHLVLPPIMIITGLVLFFKRSALREVRPDSTLACPNCQKPIAVKAAPFNWPMREMCSNCRADAVIEKS